MQLLFAILADAATVARDGRLSILNGDLGAIEATAFPAVHPYFSLVAKLRATQEDGATGHVFRAELIGPNGTQLVKPASGMLPFQVTLEDEDKGTFTAGIAISFPLLVFPTPGKYTFHLFVDDLELGTVPLLLRLIPAQASEADIHAIDAATSSQTEDAP